MSDQAADYVRGEIVNLVVIGDDKQLGPYWPIPSNVGKGLPIEPTDEPDHPSLFDHVKRNIAWTGKGALPPACSSVLQTQYRMPRCIMKLLNHRFYQDAPLVFGKSPSACKHDTPTITWIESGDTPETITITKTSKFNSKAGRKKGGGGSGGGNGGKGWFSRAPAWFRYKADKDENHNEAEIIVNQLLPQVRRANCGLSVMIITPYKLQRALIQKKLNQKRNMHADSCKCGGEECQGQVTVTTIDGSQVSKGEGGGWACIYIDYQCQCERYTHTHIHTYIHTYILRYACLHLPISTFSSQGQEADIIILSLVRQTPTSFLTRRRCCVMFSRGRRTVVVVGRRKGYIKCANEMLRDVAARALIRKDIPMSGSS